MAYKIYNISVPKKYVKDGEEKSIWNNVGKLVVFKNDEGLVSYKMELSMFPETKFGVYEQKPKIEVPQLKPIHPTELKPTEPEISPDDIPF